MTPEEIQAEWDAFIDYPEGSGKLYVTTTSALIFARSIVGMAEKRERDKLRTQNQALREALNWAMKRISSKAPHQAVEGDAELYKFATAIKQAEGGV